MRGRSPRGRLRAGPLPPRFVIVPLLGAAFLMFMPVIGIALFGRAVTRKLAGMFTQGATEPAASNVVPMGSDPAGTRAGAGAKGRMRWRSGWSWSGSAAGLRRAECRTRPTEEDK